MLVLVFAASICDNVLVRMFSHVKASRLRLAILLYKAQGVVYYIMTLTGNIHFATMLILQAINELMHSV